MISFRLLPPLPTAQRSRVVVVYKAAWATVGDGVVVGGRERERDCSAEERTPWHLYAYINALHKIVILVLLP